MGSICHRTHVNLRSSWLAFKIIITTEKVEIWLTHVTIYDECNCYQKNRLHFVVAEDDELPVYTFCKVIVGKLWAWQRK